MSQAQINQPFSHPAPLKGSAMDELSSWSDFLGVAASIGCAIHCAALPVLITVIPSWGLSWLAHESFHQWMFAICFLIAIIAFVPGLRRHGNVLPLAIGSVGLFLIGVAAFVPGHCGCGSCTRCDSVASRLTGNPATPTSPAASFGIRLVETSARHFPPLPSMLAYASLRSDLGSSSESGDRAAVRNFLAQSEAGSGQQWSGVRFVQASSRSAIVNSGEANLVSEEGSVWSFLAPWLTPLGGFFLVIAHLVNHHIGQSRCRC